MLASMRVQEVAVGEIAAALLIMTDTGREKQKEKVMPLMEDLLTIDVAVLATTTAWGIKLDMVWNIE